MKVINKFTQLAFEISKIPSLVKEIIIASNDHTKILSASQIHLQKIQDLNIEKSSYLAYLIQSLDRDLHQIIFEQQRSHTNPLTKYGKKVFSQADEDGITIEI